MKNLLLFVVPQSDCLYLNELVFTDVYKSNLCKKKKECIFCFKLPCINEKTPIQWLISISREILLKNCIIYQKTDSIKFYYKTIVFCLFTAFKEFQQPAVHNICH